MALCFVMLHIKQAQSQLICFGGKVTFTAKPEGDLIFLSKRKRSYHYTTCTLMEDQ